MQNNLETLNNTLFKTLESLKNGDMDQKKANTIVNISNTIIKNTSVQLSAYKMLKGQIKAPKIITEKQVYLSKGKNDLYSQKREFASSLGYDGLTEAIGDLGKFGFDKKFKEEFKAA